MIVDKHSSLHVNRSPSISEMEEFIRMYDNSEDKFCTHLLEFISAARGREDIDERAAWLLLYEVVHFTTASWEENINDGSEYRTEDQRGKNSYQRERGNS